MNQRQDHPQLVLASRSPRRRELLAQIGVETRCCAVELDESVRLGEKPLDYVKRLSLDKVQLACHQYSLQQDWVLGSDTAVVVGGQVLGKPENRDHFVEMMKLLSGRDHHVMTGVCVQLPENPATAGANTVRVDCSTTRVRFCELSDQAIAAYWQSGEPHDKAGGYGIQGLGATFVESIEGSYSGVVGLPLYETAKLLTAAGFPLWSSG